MIVKFINRTSVLIWIIIICLECIVADTLLSGFTIQRSRDLSLRIFPSSSTLFLSSSPASSERVSIQSSYSSVYISSPDQTVEISSTVSGNSVITSDTPVLSTLTVTMADFSLDNFHSLSSSTNIVSELLFSSTENSVVHVSSDSRTLSVQSISTSSASKIPNFSIYDTYSSSVLSTDILSASSMPLLSSDNTFSNVLTDIPISTRTSIFQQESSISDSVILAISPTRTISLHSTDSLDVISPSIVTSPLVITPNISEESITRSMFSYQPLSGISSEKLSTKALTVLPTLYITPSASSAASIQNSPVDIMSSPVLSMDISSKLTINLQSHVSLSDLSTSLLYSYVTLHSNSATEQSSKQFSTYSDSTHSPAEIVSDFYSSQLLSGHILSMQTDLNKFQTVSPHDSIISPTFLGYKTFSSLSINSVSTESITTNVSNVSSTKFVNSQTSMNKSAISINSATQTENIPMPSIQTGLFGFTEQLPYSSSSKSQLYAFTAELSSNGPTESVLSTMYEEGKSVTSKISNSLDTLSIKSDTRESTISVYSSSTRSISEQHVNTPFEKSSFLTDETSSYIHTSMILDIHTSFSNLYTRSISASSPPSKISLSSTIFAITKFLSITDDQRTSYSASPEMFNSLSESINPSKTTIVFPINSTISDSFSSGIQLTEGIDTTKNIFRSITSGSRLTSAETRTNSILKSHFDITGVVVRSDMSSDFNRNNIASSSTVLSNMKNMYSSVSPSTTSVFSLQLLSTNDANIYKYVTPSTTMSRMSSLKHTVSEDIESPSITRTSSNIYTTAVMPESSKVKSFVTPVSELYSLSTKIYSLSLSKSDFVVSIFNSESSTLSPSQAFSPSSTSLGSHVIDLHSSFRSTSLKEKPISLMTSTALLTVSSVPAQVTSSRYSSEFISTKPSLMNIMSTISSMDLGVSFFNSYTTLTHHESVLDIKSSLEANNVLSSYMSRTIYPSSYEVLEQSTRQYLLSSSNVSASTINPSSSRSPSINTIILTMTTGALDESTSKYLSTLYPTITTSHEMTTPLTSYSAFKTTFSTILSSNDLSLITTKKSDYQVQSTITNDAKSNHLSSIVPTNLMSTLHSYRISLSPPSHDQHVTSTTVSLDISVTSDSSDRLFLNSASVNSPESNTSVLVESSDIITVVTATSTFTPDASQSTNEFIASTAVSRKTLLTTAEIYHSTVTPTLTDAIVDHLVNTTISPTKTLHTSWKHSLVTNARTSSQEFSISLVSDLSTLISSLRITKSLGSTENIISTLTPFSTADLTSTMSFLSSPSQHVIISSTSLAHSNINTNYVVTSSGSSTFHEVLLDSKLTASMDVTRSVSSSYLLLTSYHDHSPINSITGILESSSFQLQSGIGLIDTSSSSVILSSLMASFRPSMHITSKSVSDVMSSASFSESVVTDVHGSSIVLSSDSLIMTSSYVAITESGYKASSVTDRLSTALTLINNSEPPNYSTNSIVSHSISNSLSLSSIILPSYFATISLESLSTKFTFRDSSNLDAAFTSVTTDSKSIKSERTNLLSMLTLTDPVEYSTPVFTFTPYTSSNLKSFIKGTSSRQSISFYSSFDIMPTKSMLSRTDALSTLSVSQFSSSHYVVHSSFSSTTGSPVKSTSHGLLLSSLTSSIDSSFDSVTMKAASSLTDFMSTQRFNVDSTSVNSIDALSRLESDKITSLLASSSNWLQHSELSFSKFSLYSSTEESSYLSHIFTPTHSVFLSISTVSAFSDLASTEDSSDFTRSISSSSLAPSYETITPTVILSDSKLITTLHESSSTKSMNKTFVYSSVVQSSAQTSMLSFVTSISDTTAFMLVSSYISSADSVRHESQLQSDSAIISKSDTAFVSSSDAISFSTVIGSSKVSYSPLISPSVTQYSGASVVASSMDISTRIDTPLLSQSLSVAPQLSVITSVITDTKSVVSSGMGSSSSMFYSQPMTLTSIESSSHSSDALVSSPLSFSQTASSKVDMLSEYSISQSDLLLTSVRLTSVVVSQALSTSEIKTDIATSSIEILENSETSLRITPASTLTPTLSSVAVKSSTNPTNSMPISLVSVRTITRLSTTSSLSISDSNVKSEIVSSSITTVSSSKMASKIYSTAFSATISPTSVSMFLTMYSVNSSRVFTDSMFSAFNQSDTVLIGNQSTPMFSFPVSLSSIPETVSVFSSVVQTTTTTTEPPEVTTRNITNVREAFWVRTVLRIQRDINTSDPEFVKEMEGRLAEAFNKAFIREKLIQEGKFEPLERRKRKKRYSSSGEAAVHIHDMTRQQDSSMVIVVYAVEKSGDILTSEEAVTALQVLGDQELAIILRQVVDNKAETYSHSSKPEVPTDEDFPLWLIGAISGGAALVIAVIWIVICFYCKCCKRERDEEEAEPELTSILQEHPQRKESKLRPLSPSQVKKPLAHHNSQHSLKKTNNYTVIEPVREPVVTNDEHKLLETHVKRVPTPPRPLPQPSSPECSTTTTPVLPKRELVPPTVKKGRRNSKNSIGPSIDELELRRGSIFSKGRKSNVSHLFQSTVSEDSDVVKEQIKYEKKKNKELLREKYGLEMEHSMENGDSFDEREKIMLDASRKNSAPSFVIASGSPAYENPTDQRRHSDGNPLEDGHLEEAKNRMHQLLDDAFSLISPRSHEAFAEINESSTDDVIRKHNDKIDDPYTTSKSQLRLEKEPQPPFNGYTNPAYTHSSSDYFETWSPYRASDQVALISMPHTLVSSVTKLGQKPDKRLTASKVGKRPASNLDILNTRAQHTDSIKSMSSHSVTREPAEPILLRTKDSGTSSDRLTSGKSQSSMGNFRNVNGKPNATKSSSGLILNGSVTSLSKLPNTDLSHSKKESVEMKPLNQNGWAKIRNHRVPEKSIKNKDEVDIVNSVEPHERTENLVQSLRDELKTLTKPANETEDDINKKPIRRKNRKINKPMTDIM
ncbi:hypothetical protein ACF0H5_016472 [Mactra antiquata]